MLALTETDLLPMIVQYFTERGWKTSAEVKIRGRSVDLLAVKDNEIVAVEMKSSLGGIQRGIEYALHQKNAVNQSYLALPKQLASSKVRETCKNLGIGLLGIDDEVTELVRPVRGESMPSVPETLFARGRREKRSDHRLTARSSLVKLFRSKTLVLILKLLVMNPAEEVHLNDLARKTGLAPSTVAKETPLLLSLGLIERRQQGNLVLYRINKDGVIYDELKRIFMKYEFLDQVIQQELPGGIDYALIYGSYAKGKEEARSDLDLLVIGKVDQDKMLQSISEAERKIGREINYNLWSTKEFQEKAKNKIPLLKEILKTPVIMIVGDEGEFKRFIRQASR